MDIGEEQNIFLLRGKMWLFFVLIDEGERIIFKSASKRVANTPTKIHIGEECFFDKT